MKGSKRYACRWWDGYMDCCRHPSYYAEMRSARVFFEPACNPRCARCREQYHEVDAQHPAWDAVQGSGAEA